MVFAFSLSFSSYAESIKVQEEKYKTTIWCEAFNWIFDDNYNKPQSKKLINPDLDCSSSSKFEESLIRASEQKNDYNFYHEIYLKVKGGFSDFEAIESSELIEAIVKAAEKKGRDTIELKKTLQKSIGVEPESNFYKAKPELNNETAQSLNLSTTQNQMEDEVNKLEQSSTLRFPFWLSILSLLLAIAGPILALVLWRTNSKNNRQKEDRHSSPKNQQIPRSQQSTYRNDPDHSNNLKFDRKINGLEEEIKNLKTELLGKIATLETVLAKSSIVDNNKMIAEDCPLKQESYFKRSIEKYAFLPEDSLIKPKDVLDNKDASAYLELTISSDNPANAYYRYNTASSAKLVLENSQDRLKTFFDIEQETLSATTITNKKDGVLVKSSKGWEIKDKAKILFK